MSATAYIVPTALLAATPPRDEWHATVIPADPTQSLVVVNWDNPNAEADFESQPGVLPLGNPWEPLPSAAAPLLASLAPAPAKGAIQLPVSTVPDTVAVALRKVQWPGARMVR